MSSRKIYTITAVRYSKNFKHIEAVKISTNDKGEKPKEMKRRQVVSLLIQNKIDIYTFYDNKIGAKVNLFIIVTGIYIKTHQDRIKKDNLDELPTF